MNFFVNVLWIFSYPNCNSKIGLMIQHYVLENFHAPFKFLLPQSWALINNDQSLNCSKLEEWFLWLSKSTKNTTLSELQEALLPPGPYPEYPPPPLQDPQCLKICFSLISSVKISLEQSFLTYLHPGSIYILDREWQNITVSMKFFVHS